MNRLNTDQGDHQVPPDDQIRVNRPIPQPACVKSRAARVIGTFVIGVGAGFVGALLLGGTEVFVLQSLDLLTNNTLLMDQLENYVKHDYCVEKTTRLFFGNPGQAHYTHISIFAMLFGVLSSTLSLCVGIGVGLIVYALVVYIYGEEAMEKALTSAGASCLFLLSVTGSVFGLAFESFLSFALNVPVFVWLIISVAAVLTVVGVVKIAFKFGFKLQGSHLNLLYGLVLIPGAAFITFLISFLFVNMRLILLAVLSPMILVIFCSSDSLQPTITPVALMLILSDVYYLAGKQIVVLQSSQSTNVNNAALESIFVGIFTSQLWMVAMAVSLFESWQTVGAPKIYGAAAGSGTAVLAAMKFVLPAFSPGVTIGALWGVAGAAGISLTAAAAATEKFGQAVGCYGFLGNLGVTVGAALGGFVSSYGFSGLSGIFFVLCAATIPQGVDIKFFYILFTLFIHYVLYIKHILVVLLLSPFIILAIMISIGSC